MEGNFDQELQDILVGISKIQKSTKAGQSLKDVSSLDVSSSASIESEIDKLNFSESIRQKIRPEAALWLGMAALVATSKDQSENTISLASKLGGHLARRRARPLGARFGKNSSVTISPRIRGVCLSFLDVGCEILEVFGVWIKFGCSMEEGQIKKLAGCMWPALNFVERDAESVILVPRFPERLPVILSEHDDFGTVALISEQGTLSFIFWMDQGIENIREIAGVAWISQGVFPIIKYD
ncbi:MAG: hypothetical protein CBC42_07405 [Betaproteobacteria bacterium TMED82]|nr:MAG: hypothetical protein CBC42_07405 [Betaproteobacteria bacterium TMED82]